MKNSGFKIILYSRSIYEELELKPEMERLRVGTAQDCDIRFGAEAFFTEFTLSFIKKEENWTAVCSDSICLRQEGVLKLGALELVPGETFRVCYSSCPGELFTAEFLYAFDEAGDYNVCFDFPGRGELRIGGDTSADILITDRVVGSNYIILRRQNGGYQADGTNSVYGVYVNGSRCLGVREVKNYDFVMLAGYSFFVRDGVVYTQSAPELSFRSVNVRIPEQEHRYRYPKFCKTTRVQWVIPEEKLEILSPPAPEELTPQSLLLLIVPALVSLALTVVLRGVMGSGGTFVIYSVCTMTMGMVLSVVNYIREKKQHEKKEKQRTGDYLQYIGGKEELLRKSRGRELALLDKIHTSLSGNLETIFQFMPNLFEKDKVHKDFLVVRLGTGSVLSLNQVVYKPLEMASQDALAYYPEQLAQKYQYLDNAPVVLNLREKAAVGVVGGARDQEEFLRTILLDLVIRHSFQDVRIICFDRELPEGSFQWLRWLKHNTDDKTGQRWNAFDEESKNDVLDFLYNELSRRDSLSDDQKEELTYYVVVVRDRELISNHPVMGYVKSSAQCHVCFLFVTDSRELLPAGLSALVNLQGNGRACLVDCGDGDCVQAFTYETTTQAEALRAAYKLAGITLEEFSLESSLTRQLSLYKLLGIKNVRDLDLNKRWSASEVASSLAAPLGVKAGGEPVYLDIHEKAHGPHGLVAGTTGSGKSEIIQTYLLSLATLFHPYEVAFVIIDFKGDGMVGQLRGLPHLAGAITNIDGREINRSLLSIRAELQKRERYFAQAKVNHIDKYIQKYKAGECKIPLPHLILIVDEFAELKSEQPEFMKELISTARIGRSLGIHLILATQKPAGVVNDQIWSNSRFKLCLKVQNKEDSNEVLKSPLAAEIREPGRAYLQVGNQEIFELFQSAYSGASARSEEAGNRKRFSVAQLDPAGRRSVVYRQQPESCSDGSGTQLNAIVEYVGQFCKEEGIEGLPGICLPPLPLKIGYEERVPGSAEKEFLAVPFGRYDDPEHQYQGEVSVNLSTNHLLIIGAPQYGKTNMLQLAVRYVAEHYAPEEVVIYILDCSSRILKNFAELAHVGGVILASEEDRMKYFMKMIKQELEWRKEKLAELGLSSFAAYREAGYRDFPMILVALDNFTAFHELYEEYEDRILNLLRDGITAGITLITVNGQTSGISFRLRSAFTKKLALYCNDSGEYASLLDRCRMEPSDTVGRGLAELDRKIYEFQSYLCFDGEREKDRVENMRRFAEQINARYGGRRAARLPEMPPVVTERYLMDTFRLDIKGTYLVAVGMDYDSMEPVTLNLLSFNLLGISGVGEYQSAGLLHALIGHLLRNMFKAPAEVYLLDGPKRRLKEFADLGIVKDYSIDGNALSAWVEELYPILKNRYEVMQEQGASALEKEPLLCIIVENREAAVSLSGDTDNLKRFQEMLSKYRDTRWLMIYSDLENAGIGYSSPAALKPLSESKNLIFFGSYENMKLFDTKIRQGSFRKEMAPGDAFYWRDQEILKLKTIKQAEV